MPLQLPLTTATQEVVFINTSDSDEKTFLLKSKEQRQRMSMQSTDIEAGNLIIRYIMHPRLLENWCQADYALKLNVLFPSKKHAISSDIVESQIVEEMDE